jgi:HK97 family phage prohead protease
MPKPDTDALIGPDPICRRGEGFADNLGTDEDGRITGRAVPYGRTVELTAGLLEEFTRGTFKNATKDPGRVKIAYEHGQVIGHMTALEERDDGLWFHGRISDNPAIPEAARARAMIAEGLADEMSVGFRTVKGGTHHETLGGATKYTHTRAQLLEVSLVPWGAYGREATLSRARLVDAGQLLVDARRAEMREWLAEFQARALG